MYKKYFQLEPTTKSTKGESTLGGTTIVVDGQRYLYYGREKNLYAPKRLTCRCARFIFIKCFSAFESVVTFFGEAKQKSTRLPKKTYATQ